MSPLSYYKGEINVKSERLKNYLYLEVNDLEEDDLYEEIYEDGVSENIQNKIRAKKKKELKKQRQN